MDIRLCNGPAGLVMSGAGPDAREHVSKCVEAGLTYIVVENVLAGPCRAALRWTGNGTCGSA